MRGVAPPRLWPPEIARAEEKAEVRGKRNEEDEEKMRGGGCRQVFKEGRRKALFGLVK